MKRVDQHKMFGGQQEVWEFASDTLAGTTRFGIFLPEAAKDRPLPVLYFLSGLTCTEQNFVSKAGAQRYAAANDIIIVAPDTSPRGDDVADAEGYDLGKGAGFYINATQAPWTPHYRMHDFVVHELHQVVQQHFPATDQRSVSGHSMGGHGALVAALRNPGMFKSVSALSPIVAPSSVPWGEKAFTAYLGSNRETWREWDACELIAAASERLELFVDQGKADQFLDEQLHTHRLEAACKAAEHPLTLRYHEGYDHSYYFIATMMADHVDFHAAALHGRASA